ERERHDNRIASLSNEEREHRNDCSERSCETGDPSLAQWRDSLLTDLELFLHLLLEHALGICHYLCRECVCRLGIHSFCFINECQLITLDLGHQRDLVALHCNLVVVNFALAFRREVSARSHRQCIRDETGNAGYHHCLVLLCGRSADHSGNKAEVGGESIVEAVHDVSKEPAGFGAMPRFALFTGNPGECCRVLGGFFCKCERFAAAWSSGGSRSVHVEVGFYFTTL